MIVMEKVKVEAVQREIDGSLSKQQVPLDDFQYQPVWCCALIYHLLVATECCTLLPTDNTFSSCVCNPSFMQLVIQLLFVIAYQHGCSCVEVWNVMWNAQGSKSEPTGNFTEDR